MKKWNTPAIEELALAATEKPGNGNGNGKGNNDTNSHLGWCEMHKHPELGICTCGRGNGVISGS